jgi:predicted nucleotidyltransferase
VEHSELLEKLASALDRLGVRYAIVGSTASIVYGEPRFTNDIDVVIELWPQHIASFCNVFPGPEFYLSRSAVESAIQQQFQFNIIHPSSGLKIDCIVAKSDAFDQNQLSRAVPMMKEGGAYPIRLASPEDVIIKKMEYFRMGESEKHIRDICGILKAQRERIDRAYIRHWAQRMELTEIWDAVLARLEAG